MKKIVLAVCGLPGAGKTEATQYILQKTNWSKVYFGDATFEELQKRGLEKNEANERIVREDLRKIHGMAAYAILSLPKIREFHQNGPVVLESFYSWEEYLTVKQEFGDDFKVLAIFASPQIRIKRMASRPVRPLTAEELVSRDYSQIENLHQAGPIARADFMIINEGSLEELQTKIDEVLNKLNES